MSVIDIVLGALILFGLLRGFTNGLFVEVASLAALIAGVYGAIHFSNFVAEFLNAKVDWSEKTINIIAFAITFIVIVIVITLAGKALTTLANFAALGIINRFLGALFGGLKFAVILSIVLIVFEKVNKTMGLMDKNELNESVLYTPVKSLAPLILPSITALDEDETQDTTQDII